MTTNLITRAADVHLKERRKLILVPRETPLSLIHLENMVQVTRAGAIVLPAMPGWYHQPRGLDDLIDFIVARICDQLGVPNRMIRRWGGEEATPPANGAAIAGLTSAARDSMAGGEGVVVTSEEARAAFFTKPSDEP